MSIKFGMTLAQVFNQLVKGYQKVRGVEPKGLDLIKIKQEAMQRFQDMRKVLDMQGNPIDPSKPIMGGSQQGEALKSGIMKATGAKPKKVLSEDEIRKKLMDQNKKNLESMKSKLDDSEDFASGGRAGFKDGEGIMQMASVDDPFYRSEDEDEHSFRMFKKPYKELNADELEEFQEEMMRLMNKFASNDMNERLLEKLFEDLLEQGLSPEEAEIKAREMLNEMGDMSSIPDRGAQSITLADGGRAAFKDGLLAKLNKPFKIDSGTLRSMFFNKNNPIITGFNTSELFDLVTNLSSSIPFADGGRAEYKDGPKDPRRRTFMKAAAGIASMIPFGGAKIIGKAAPVVTKAAEISGPALAKIVDTVMSLGKLISVKGKRVKEMVTKKKHEGVEVTEDIMDGSYTIKKGGKEIYYKPGRRDEMGIEDDIIEVIEKTVTKKAGGGVARLLGE
jgi:hypothetical protein